MEIWNDVRYHWILHDFMSSKLRNTGNVDHQSAKGNDGICGTPQFGVANLVTSLIQIHSCLYDLDTKLQLGCTTLYPIIFPLKLAVSRPWLVFICFSYFGGYYP